MTLPLGYRYAAVYAGIRKAGKDDLSLIVSDRAASAAAVFTQNRVQAAPVKLARQNLVKSGGKVRAIMTNAGNANCATRTGDRVARETVKALADGLGIAPSEVLPASTGVIGVELNPTLITHALPAAIDSLSPDLFQRVAEAILTTDLVPKTAFATVRTKRGEIRIAGMTKGSGMIHPNMATTLGYIMTDAGAAPEAVGRILKRAVAASYNSMSVDGDTSTNDTLALLANGASGVSPVGKDLLKFAGAVTEVAQSLAKQIARDGEGAKKLVTIEVTGAPSDAAARKIARAIANSPLVKTAIAGSDPNWGRILCAAGYAGVEFDPAKVDIEMQGMRVCAAGLAADFSEAELAEKLNEPDCLIRFRIRGKGKGKKTFWTCDLTHGYIDINASYRT